MRKNNIKKTIISILCVILIFTACALPISANSVQTWFEGVDSTGAIMPDKQSPIIVERELLTFDIGELPQSYYHDKEKFFAYNAKVTAEYTFYNPSDYTVTAKLLFPFGTSPMYAVESYFDEESREDKPYDDTHKFNITINGEVIEKRIRHTLSYTHEQFELEQDLSLLCDGFVTDSFYKPDLTVTKYTFMVNGVNVEQHRASDIGFDIPKGLGDRRIYFPEQNGMHTQKNGDIRIHTNVGNNGRDFDLYVFGTPFTTLPTWTAYKDGGVEDNEAIAGNVYLIKTETTTLKDFALANRDEDSVISESDWYNAFIADIKHSHQRTPDHPVVYCERNNNQFEKQMMRWYEYEITLAPGERIINTVTAPIYPSIDLDFEPDIFKYTYLLSPAKTWKSFGELEIVVNTPYYMTENSITGFTKTDKGYSVKLDRLPDKELQFTLSTSETPQRPPKTLKDIIPIEMIISFSIIGGVALLIGGGIALLVSRTRKKKKS